MKSDDFGENDHRRFRPPPTAKYNYHDGRQTSAMIFELLNPLDNIYLSAEMLRSVIPQGDGEVYLDVIARNATRMDHLIKTFLFPVEQPGLPVEKNYIHQLLDEVLEIAKAGISRKQVAVIKEYTAGDYKTAYNQQAVKIALTILIMNVINGLEHGVGELVLTTILIHDKLVVVMEDNGPAISEHYQEVDGTGLSFATAFYLLRSNDINVEVQTRTERGTSYTLMFKGFPV